MNEDDDTVLTPAGPRSKSQVHSVGPGNIVRRTGEGTYVLVADSPSEHGSGRTRRDEDGGDGSVMSSMVGSAWSSARESLVPMIEDAASQAGEYLAKNGPEIVRENIVPRFIRGFERGRGSADDE